MARKPKLKFNSHLIEFINKTLNFGFKPPGVLEYQRILHDILNLINNFELKSTLIIPLKEYINSYFYESNLNFCSKYGLDKN